MKIALPNARPLSVTDEIALLRGGLIGNPQQAALRDRLAALLIQRDAFDEAIILLTDAARPSLDYAAQMALTGAYFARSNDGDADRAAASAEQALALASLPRQQARAMADIARADLRRGCGDAALARLEAALTLDPADVRTFQRLAMEWLRRGQAARVIALTDDLLARNIAHARILSARATALVMDGQIADAQALVGLPGFLFRDTIPTPPGWISLPAFNSALANEIMANPDLRYGRHGTASQHTWRVDDPLMGDTPAVAALLQIIAAIAADHAQDLATASHRWRTARPAQASLRCWCVITESAGSELWHMHPDGWLSGGYYIDVPDSVVAGADPAGCLAFGLPDGIIGADAAAAFGEIHVRPNPGLLTLFPSHAHHRTYSHGSSGRRMCLAFDICPA